MAFFFTCWDCTGEDRTHCFGSNDEEFAHDGNYCDCECKRWPTLRRQRFEADRKAGRVGHGRRSPETEVSA